MLLLLLSPILPPRLMLPPFPFLCGLRLSSALLARMKSRRCCRSLLPRCHLSCLPLDKEQQSCLWGGPAFPPPPPPPPPRTEHHSPHISSLVSEKARSKMDKSNAPAIRRGAVGWTACLLVALLATALSSSPFETAAAAPEQGVAAAPRERHTRLPTVDLTSAEGSDASQEATEMRHLSYKAWRKLAGTALLISADAPEFGYSRGDVLFVAVEERDVGGFFSEPVVVRHLVSSWGCMLHWWEDQLERSYPGRGRWVWSATRCCGAGRWPRKLPSERSLTHSRWAPIS